MLGKALQIAAGQGLPFGVPAEGVDFDGTNDYLSRSSDLTGNADGKTFTISAWVYKTGTANECVFFNSQSTSPRVKWGVADTSDVFECTCQNSAGSNVLSFQTTTKVPRNTWVHILCSVDLTNSSNRYVYFNDVAASVTWSTYTNDNIDFTQASGFYVGKFGTSNPTHKGRLSNVYLDYTYRDLSVESNRRLFIDADLKPADGQSLTLQEVAPFALGDGTTGTYFDGSTEYLSKSTDLTGNADGKTFTFSAWVYADEHLDQAIYQSKTALGNFLIQFRASSSFYIQMFGDGVDGTTYLGMNTGATGLALNTWNHLLISVDMANASNRYVYLNDIQLSPTWSTYTNANIDFTGTDHYIGKKNTAGWEFKGRLAHVYLDYTYRDLSNSANRRLFIDASGNPATGQASLSPILYLPLIDDFTNDGTGGAFTTNGTPSQGDTETTGAPILYLPMTDADTAHVNEGTGGDFTANGTFATSQRGPNQDNCVSSRMNPDLTNADSLNSPLGLRTYTQLTLAFNTNLNTGDAWRCYSNNGADPFLNITNSPSINLQISQFSPSYVNKGSIGVNLGGRKGNAQVVITIDVTTGDYQTSVDGVVTTGNVSLAAGDAQYQTLQLKSPSNTDWYIGEFYLDETYTDLSTNNPFWDADANRPKPVRQVLEETGNTPLIAMPIEASNAGLNLGTGGNFTVNSGPFTGARGGSEFWARSLKGDGSTGYLNNNATGVSDSKTFSLVFSFKATGANNLTYMNFTNGTFYSLEIFTEFSVTNIIAKNSSGTVILDEDWAGFPSGLTTGQDYVFLVSVDLNAGVTAVYHAHTLLPVTSTTKTNDTIGFSGDDCWISRGRYYSPSDQAIHYFTTDYIDFSQESNRLKFVDAFGYPIDLQPAIDAGDIPNPLVYMKFDDPDALGTNSGTGGNFTVNGTVTQGADVDPNA